MCTYENKNTKNYSEGLKAIYTKMCLKFSHYMLFALFRSYSTFAYLIRVYIHNINKRMYIISARGHELSGRVRAHAYILIFAP